MFAVPLLVYGLAVAPREAVGISLTAVGGTALLGVIPRLFRREVELRTGFLFAMFGMLGAPLGNWVSSLIPENTLLVLFALLMFYVAFRMWRKSRQAEESAVQVDCGGSSGADVPHSRQACQRTSDGQLRLTSRCAMLLSALGFLTGFLSGMFGVGGGFVIVPALVLFSGMAIHQAIATSLMVIVLVSISGISSYLISGGTVSWTLTGLFIIGGFLGMQFGSAVSKKVSGPRLQKIFATAVVMVALFVIAKSAV